ncbi:MAG: methyltransferase domain-containing protein, partial [Candidatus Gastranaerophilaceae bacterium]
MNFLENYTDKKEWEEPICNYCGSDKNNHSIFLKNPMNSGTDLVKCNKCGLKFYSPRVKFDAILNRGYTTDQYAKKEAENFFENCSFFEVENKEQQKKLIKDYYCGKVQSIVDMTGVKPKSVIEIGGCVGYFLSAIKSMGAEKIAGCDINIWSAKIAQEKFGFSDYEGCMFSKYAIKDTYDWGVMLDYIEHTYTPFDDLKKICSALKPGGILLIKTFSDDKDTNHEMLAPFGHPIHFDESVLLKMISDSGFKVVKF